MDNKLFVKLSSSIGKRVRNHWSPKCLQDWIDGWGLCWDCSIHCCSGKCLQDEEKKINLKWTFRIDCWQCLRGQSVTLFQFWGYHDSSSPSSSLWNIDVGIWQKCSKWCLYYWQLVGNSSLTEARITLPSALFSQL